mmetsp:Transcript_160440/g.293087  ORF Transcript_160440/g.293087 Transcript_160440/m.293087 type:complete len:388 (+) Transcript_160440:72-1235(+)
MDIYKVQQIAQMHPGLIRPPPGLASPASLETSSYVDSLTARGLDPCELFHLLQEQSQAKVQRPPGDNSLSALQGAAVKPKLQPPPGNFRLPPPPGCFDVKCQPSTGQPVSFPPPGCFHMDMLGKQPPRPPGNWDTMSLASTGMGDDASVPSMGSLPEFSDWLEDYRTSSIGSLPEFSDMLEDSMNEEEIKADPKPKRVSFGSVQTVFYEEGLSLPDFAAHLCKAKPPLDDCSPERNEYKAHEDRVEQVANSEPVLLQWTVDAKKLKSSDRQIISPNLEISPTAAVKLIIKPKSIGDGKGQANFRNSQGVGSLEVKFTKTSSCAPKIRFCIGIGEQDWRGPVEHDFGRNSLCTLPKEMQEWDFRSFVKPKSSTFLVSLQLLGITQCAD